MLLRAMMVWLSLHWSFVASRAQNFSRDNSDLIRIKKYPGSSWEYFPWVDTASDQGEGYLDSGEYN